MENEEKKTYKYDAFISYRHSMPDKEVAEKIQKKLERFRLPSSVARRIGRKKLNRIFRDEAELSVSEELSRSIDEALFESEYLIVICSPRLPKSEWCLREIETFLKIRGKKNILLVLIEGTPDESFPEILLYEDIVTTDTSGNEVTVPQRKEPLAANCPVTSKHVKNDAIKDTSLRLSASLFGVNFDDLKRRQRNQSIRRTVEIGALIFLVLSVMLIQSLIFVKTLNEKNKIIADKLADSTANASKALYKEGLKLDAVYAARSVLPDHEEEGFSDNALRALVNAEGLYATPGSFVPSDNVLLPSLPNNTKFSPDERYFMSSFSDGNCNVFDLTTGKVLWTKENVSFSKEFFVFDNKGNFLFCDNSKICYSSVNNTSETVIDENPGYLYASPDGEYILGCTPNGFFTFSDGAIRSKYEYEKNEIEDFLEYPWQCVFSSDNRYCCFSLIGNDDSEKYKVICMDLSDGSIKYNEIIQSTVNGHYYDGKALYLLTAEEKNDERISYLSLINPSDNTVKQTITFEGNEYISMFFVNDYIVISNFISALILDKSFCTVSSPGLSAYIFNVVPTEDSFLCLTNDSKLYQWNKETKTLEVLSEIEFGYDPLELCLINKTLYYSSYTQAYITTYVEAESDYITEYKNSDDIEELYPTYTDYKEQTHIMSELEKKYGNDISYIILSNDNKYIAVKLSNKKITICKSSDFEEVGHFYVDIDYYHSDFIYDNKSGCYMLFGEDICILDKKFRHIASIKGLQLNGKRTKDQSIILSDKKLKNYTINIASYDEIIAKADEILGSYQPDESVMEQYGLGD